MKSVVADIEVLYPHIVDRLIALWGKQHFYTYFDSLYLMERTSRQGFELEILSDLMFLYTVHVIVYGDSRPVDVWPSNTR
jgi:hypothetical protein